MASPDKADGPQSTADESQPRITQEKTVPIWDKEEQMKRWYDEGIFTDATIKCGERTWKVHRIVICSQSEFFTNAHTKGFKEAQEQLVTLQDEVPEAVDAMIQFMYKGVASIPSQHESYEPVYDDCKRWDIDPWESDESVAVHGQHISTAVDWCLTAIRMSDKYNIPEMKTAAAKCLDKILRAPMKVDPVRLVFENRLTIPTFCTLLRAATDPDLPEVDLYDRMIRICAANWSTFMEGSEPSPFVGIRKIIYVERPSCCRSIVEVIADQARGRRPIYVDNMCTNGRLRPTYRDSASAAGWARHSSGWGEESPNSNDGGYRTFGGVWNNQ